MTDSEVEDWETKIKSALLRRDSTLSSVGDAMKNILLQGVSVNGKQMYLSDFGINTLGYFTAAENEKNAYHIDGNSDDENSTVRSSDDVLKSMIASDPDTVMDFFTGLANNLHDSLLNQMSASSLSSAFTVYNDKQMSDEYDDYTDKISAQEDKLNDLIDKWYDKFSTMETALAKLDSKSSSLSSLLGG
jgi:flagellar hook-associated protein 2